LDTARTRKMTPGYIFVTHSSDSMRLASVKSAHICRHIHQLDGVQFDFKTVVLVVDY